MSAGCTIGARPRDPAPLRLDASAAELEAARLLRRHRPIVLRISPERAAAEFGTNYLVTPDSVDFLLGTGRTADFGAAWPQIEVTTTQAFGYDRLAESIYFDLVVRRQYSPGLAGSAVRNLDNFMELAKEPCVLVLIGTGDERGAALLKPIVEPQLSAVAGLGAMAPWLEVAIVVAPPALEDDPASVYGLLAEVCRQAGFEWMSLGREPALCPSPRLGTLLAKVQACAVLVARRSALASVWLDAPSSASTSESVLWTEQDGALIGHCLGPVGTRSRALLEEVGRRTVVWTPRPSRGSDAGSKESNDDR